MLLHTWSLAVEEQFYLIWPLTILLIRKPKVLLMLAGFILVMTGIVRFLLWEYQIKDLAYASLYTFTRIDGLCVGAMLALLMHRYPGFLKKYTTVIVLLMAAINFGFYFINGRLAFTLPYLAVAGYTTFAVLFGLLVHEAVTGESKLVRLILDNRLLKFFGRISYGLYVYHWPVYILLFPLLNKLLRSTGIISGRLAEAAGAVAATAIAVGISVISYKYIESFFLKYKTRFT